VVVVRRNAVLAFIYFILSIAILSTEYRLGALEVRSSLYSGFYHGQLGEYVYNGDDLASYLDWELEPLYFVGAEFDFEFDTGLYARADFSAGIPGTVGTIEDSDWADEDDPSIKTHFSAHDNVLTGALSSRLQLGYQHWVSEKISLSAALGLSLMYFHMDAVDGYLEYPPGSEKVDSYGVGISYRQFYRIPHIGIGLATDRRRSLVFSSELLFSPFAACDAVDNHHKKGLDYYDFMRNGLFFAVEMGMDLELAPQRSFRVDLSYIVVPEYRGTSYFVCTDTIYDNGCSYEGYVSPTYTDAAGASLTLFGLSLGYRIELQ